MGWHNFMSIANRSILARILIYGDIHLSSKNYGAHRNYPKESLGYFQNITKLVEEYKATHLIGTGDLTYGRFNTLEYRYAVEKELERQYELVNGNRYEVEGNHDTATYGMTEYEYYVNKGLLKRSTNISIGALNISMVDYGKDNKTEIIQPSDDTISVVVAHDYCKFADTQLPDYGKKYIELDNKENWFGVDYIICGHIHNYEMFKGLIIKDGYGHDAVVTYLGCMSRPAYREGHMQDNGKIMLLTVYDNREVQIDYIDVPLLPIDESFNLEQKQAEKEKEDLVKIDVSDIVHKLENHQRMIGNPEDIIISMEDVDIRYRNKAIELLKSAHR